jgi:REP element-mobilizing transposase RayT
MRFKLRVTCPSRRPLLAHGFLKTLAEACQKTGWQVHAYYLMRNHFHLAAETPEPNLVDGVRWLLGTDTIRLNHRRKFWAACCKILRDK